MIRRKSIAISIASCIMFFVILLLISLTLSDCDWNKNKAKEKILLKEGIVLITPMGDNTISKEIKIGDIYKLNNKSPFKDEEIVTARIIAIKDGWVRVLFLPEGGQTYSSMEIEHFLSIYTVLHKAESTQ